MTRSLRNTFLIFLLFAITAASAQKRKDAGDDKRKLSRSEVHFIGHAIDSIKHNLNRMIIFEKELRQRNYYLNEKTALVEELISIIKSMQQSLAVVQMRVADVKSMFGKPAHKTESVMVYEIETYKSNCPFMQITFHLQQELVSKLDYKITDCQRWK